MELTSLDYARLVQYAAYKLHRVVLNKTQINKILFYAYGIYLVDHDEPFFKNEGPMAWPYGPVFPIVNKRIEVNSVVTGFPKDIIAKFNENPDAMTAVRIAVDRLYDKTALELTHWSHEDDSPWAQSLYEKDENGNVIAQNKWNTPINLDYIKNYFQKVKK